MLVVHIVSASSTVCLGAAGGNWSWWTTGEGRREDREPLKVGRESLRSKRGASRLVLVLRFLPVEAEKEKSSMVMRRDDSFAVGEGAAPRYVSVRSCGLLFVGMYIKLVYQS